MQYKNYSFENLKEKLTKKYASAIAENIGTDLYDHITDKEYNLLTDFHSESEDLGPIFLETVKGSLSEERRNSSPRSYRAQEKLINSLHRKTTFQLNQKLDLNGQKYSVVDSTQIDQTFNVLSELTSRYPGIQNWNLKIVNRKRDGKNKMKRFLETTYAFHFITDNPVLRLLYAEDIMGICRSMKNQSKNAELLYELLQTFHDPEITDLFFENVEFKASRYKLNKKKVQKNLKDHLSSIFIIYIDKLQYFKHPKRKQGYHDKGSSNKTTKFDQGCIDSERYKFIYNSDLINEEGVYIMDKVEKSYKQVLVDSIETESLENLLETLKRHNRERDLFHKQTFKEIEEILNSNSLTSEEKVEVILKNEQFKRKK